MRYSGKELLAHKHANSFQKLSGEVSDPFADLEDCTDGSCMSKTPAVPAKEAADRMRTTNGSLHSLKNAKEEVKKKLVQKEESGCMSEFTQAEPKMSSKNGPSTENIGGLPMASPAYLPETASNHPDKARRLRPYRYASLNGMSREAKVKKAAGVVPELADEDLPVKLKQTPRDKISQEKTSSTTATCSDENASFQSESHCTIHAKANLSFCILPYQAPT